MVFAAFPWTKYFTSTFAVYFGALGMGEENTAHRDWIDFPLYGIIFFLHSKDLNFTYTYAVHV